MTFQRLCIAFCAVVMAQPALSDPAILHLRLISSSQGQSYGIYLAAAKDLPCAYVRYQISGVAGRAQTVALRPGDATVLALGQGWPPGEQALELRAMGCLAWPSEARRVRLHAASPDHTARASLEADLLEADLLEIGLADIKADALRQRKG